MGEIAAMSMARQIVLALGMKVQALVAVFAIRKLFAIAHWMRKLAAVAFAALWIVFAAFRRLVTIRTAD